MPTSVGTQEAESQVDTHMPVACEDRRVWREAQTRQREVSKDAGAGDRRQRHGPGRTPGTVSLLAATQVLAYARQSRCSLPKEAPPCDTSRLLHCRVALCVSVCLGRGPLGPVCPWEGAPFSISLCLLPGALPRALGGGPVSPG